MVATRCMKCMTPLEGGGQYCDDCNPVIQAQVIQATLAESSEQSQQGEAEVVILRRSEVHFGGFFVRAAAFCADWLLLGAIGVVVAFAMNNIWAGLLAMFGAGLICSAGFWIADGATPGKMLFGLKVRMIDGRSIEPVSAVIRYFAYLASGLLFGVGFIVILFSEERRALHDMIANTVVLIEKDRHVPAARAANEPE